MKDGGPAFPMYCDYSKESGSLIKGMSLRDWFAALAMQAFMNNPELVARAATEAKSKKVPFVAEASYQMADAMLKEREK